jgi:hypothetical protein
MRRTFLSTAVLLSIITARSVGSADTTTVVYTPKGTPIDATKMTFELSSAEIQMIHQMVASNYPNAVRETSASRLYNCHSYAWYNQSTSNDIWFNTPGDDMYWSDGSYHLVMTANGGLPIPSSVANGAKVSYGNADHSAIKVNSTQYRSKWGQWPRMLHQPSYCPYACLNCSFTVQYYQ